MKAKSLGLAILAVFVGIWFSDFLIHGVWLRADYASSHELWRTEAEMQARIGWLMGGELLAAVTFVLLYARGFTATLGLGGALLYGAGMGFFSQAATLIDYAVLPLPPALAAKWVIAGIAQGLLAGILVFFTYRPRAG